MDNGGEKMKYIKYITCLLTLSIMINSFLVHSVNADARNGMILVYDGQSHIYNEAPIYLVVKGNIIQGDIPPIALNGNTLVPIREVCEAMGAVVEWKTNTKEAYIGMDDSLIILKADSYQAWVNGEYVNIPMPAKIINNKVMVPVRFVAETIGYDVKWFGTERIIMIDSKNEDSRQEENHDTTTDIIDHEDTEDIEDIRDITDNEDNGDNKENKDNQTNSDSVISDGTDFKQNVAKLPTKLADDPVVIVSDKEVPTESASSAIESKDYPTTDIISAGVLESVSDGSHFKVTASSPISSLEHMSLEGKIVVDIYNANMKLSNTNMAISNNPFVKSIRTSQFSSNPKVTRVVFDLINQNDYEITMASDRMSFIVRIKKSVITKIELSQNSRGDILTILANAKPSVTVSRLTNPDRLVIDIPNAEANMKAIEKTVKGQYVKAIRTSQFNVDTYRVVLDLEGQPEYEIISVGANGIAVQLITPTFKNIKFLKENSQIAVLKPNKEFNINDITHNDDYMNRIYTLTLPGDYSSVYGQGIFHIGDEKLNYLQISNSLNNKTEFKFAEKTISAVEIYDKGDYFVISLIKPREKYSKIITLDAGHGGSDPGAVGNGLKEKDVNLDILLKLNALLKNSPDIKVYTTRTSDTYPTLQDRSTLANEVEADFFLSIHNNAFNGKNRGTETLYFPTAADNTPQFSGKKMAQIFQNNLVSRLGTMDRGIKERPGLYVLRTTTMPAVIVEIAFIDNAQDAQLLKSDSFKQEAARALYDGILTIFEQYPTYR